MHDLHGPAAKNIGGANDNGVSDGVSRSTGFFRGARDAAFRLMEPKLFDECIEAIAVLCQIDRVG